MPQPKLGTGEPEQIPQYQSSGISFGASTECCWPLIRRAIIDIYYPILRQYSLMLTHALPSSLFRPVNTSALTMVSAPRNHEPGECRA